MFCSHYNLNYNYKDHLVNNIEIYSRKDGIHHCQTYFGVLQSVIEVSNPRDDVYEKFKSLKDYKKYIDNYLKINNLNYNYIKNTKYIDKMYEWPNGEYIKFKQILRFQEN